MEDRRGYLLKTGQVASLLGLSTTQVLKYCNTDMLKCCLMPKKQQKQQYQHRRFDIREVYQFLKKHNMPVAAIEEEFPFLLVEKQMEVQNQDPIPLSQKDSPSICEKTYVCEKCNAFTQEKYKAMLQFWDQNEQKVRIICGACLVSAVLKS